MYKSRFEAYPFLREDKNNLMCDFEIMTDEIVSKIGYLRALCREESLRAELLKIGEIVYHLNPTLRTKLSLGESELNFILDSTALIESQVEGRCTMFVLPQGSERAAYSHILRNNFKTVARLAYINEQNGGKAQGMLYDFLGALSDYFFQLSLLLNKLDGIDEVPFVSKNYKL